MKMKLIISGIMLTLLCLLGGCDDKLEVQQAYDFSLTSWYLQKTISPDETVEIRLTLNRSGNYEEAGYHSHPLPSHRYSVAARSCSSEIS